MNGVTRIWAVGAGGAMLAILAGGFFLGAQPQLAHAEEAAGSAAALESQTQVIDSKLSALARAAAQMPKLQAQEVVLKKAVPSRLQANTFVRRMNELAALDSVTIKSITVGEVAAYVPPKSAALASTTPVATPAPSASPAAAVAPIATPVGPRLAATDPSITAQNFIVIPMTVVIDGTVDAGQQFTRDVQRDERLFLVTGYSTTVDEDNPADVTTTLIGSVYALKD